MFDLSSVSSNTFYREFRCCREIPPIAQAKEYPSLSIDWKEIYSLAFNLILDTNFRVFQYKLLNRIIFTNDKLFKFKLVDLPSYIFCKTNEESLEHLLFLCKITERSTSNIISFLLSSVYLPMSIFASSFSILHLKPPVGKHWDITNHTDYWHLNTEYILKIFYHRNFLYIYYLLYRND